MGDGPKAVFFLAILFFERKPMAYRLMARDRSHGYRMIFQPITRLSCVDFHVAVTPDQWWLDDQ